MDAKSILKDVFGYDNFRFQQENIISNIMEGNDTLAVLPTGAGKSLCYQIPAIAADGLTIVVSPLISLMKDQVNQLEERGINAVMINSSISAEEKRERVARVIDGNVKLLYMAPETIMQDETTEMLKDTTVSYIAVDEAHCISEWGHEFRPSYRELTNLRELHPSAICIALTATATVRVRKDIKKILTIDDGSEFVSSFDRPNLKIMVKSKNDAWRSTYNFVRTRPEGSSGIVYCSSRKTTESIANLLGQRGISVLPYHAGLKDTIRQENQEKFMNGEVDVMVATIAFGMGIDKPDIRWILHYDIPSNIESYYQQIGRAGRDGEKSDCLMLFGKKDLNIIKYFHRKLPAREKTIAEGQLKAFVSYCECNKCRRVPLLNYFNEKYSKGPCGMCDNCK